MTALAAVYSTRLLGLFLILPVFALYAEGLSGYTPALAGLALGIYGLTQACLQVPFGIVSDRVGRKPVIVVGLMVFAAGSIVAAMATSIEGVLLGRALQGAGAVSAAVMALVADVTRDVVRSRAMAVIGITIGASFLVSLLLGPVLDGFFGVSGIFWLTAGLAVAGIAIIVFAVPRPPQDPAHHPVEAEPQKFIEVLFEPRLAALNAGIFVLHAVLMAVFVVIPGALAYQVGLPAADHWQIYVPILVVATAFLFPLLSWAERKHRTHGLLLGSIALLTVALVLLGFDHATLGDMVLGLFLFFYAFNVLEASLPSAITKTVSPSARGAAIGIYSTSQFLGAFAGGAAGGWIHGRFGISTVFFFSAALTMLWLVIACRVPARPVLAKPGVRVES